MQNLEDAFVLEKSTARAMARWLQERCEQDPQAVTPFAALHADWLRWADAHRCRRSSIRRLAMALVFLGYRRCVLRSGRTRAYRGIALKAGGGA
jgi:hypothetical protein